MVSVIFLVVKFYLFFTFLYLLGRAFIILISKFLGQNLTIHSQIQGLDIQIFFPILGLFFLGNYLFILNYFIPLKSSYTFLILPFLLINLFEIENKNRLKSIFWTLPFYIIVIISSYDINFHYDAGLYHLNNQLWIRESNILLGFSNIYGAFGVSSIYEYLSAFLWFDNSFILVHFLNIIFVGFLYTFLYYNLSKNKNLAMYSGSFFIVLYSIFDNVGFGGGRNGFITIQSIGKQDLSISVLFLSVSAILLTSILKRSYDEKDLVLLTILSLFIFQLKISGFPIIFIYIFYLFKYVKANKISVFILLKKLKLYITLVLIWLLKSILHTGCIIFPLEISCVTSLDWVNANYINNIENISVNYSNSYYFNESIISWAKRYFELPINLNVFSNFIISVIAFFLIRKIFFYNKSKATKNPTTFLLLFFISLFYLRYGPDIRYLSGIMMLGIFSIGVGYLPKQNLPRVLINALLLLSIIMVPKIQSYKSINFDEMPSVLVPEEPMIALHERLAPKSGDQCWLNIKCSANLENYEINDSNFYKIVILVD
tara:strand:- start:7827 stop:9455 length:1629 start_codon:yes stop_codon:yes gene_type:complete